MLIESLEQGRSIRLRCPAKLNLFLDTLGKRSDGYHEISTVMCPIDLWDDLEISVRHDSQVKLQISFPELTNPEIDSGTKGREPAWDIPADESNLVFKAARAGLQALGIYQGLDIQLTKRIPAVAGLGGGSSDAAATVMATWAIWGDWNRLHAEDVCQKLGSDINFFMGTLDGIGMAHATGRGELIRSIGFQPKLHFWLTHPPEGCSTAQVYAKLDRVGNLSKTEEFLATCQTGQESKIGAAMFNALQLPATQLNSWIHKQSEVLAEGGCRHVLMSGSGSSCFGIAPASGSFQFFRSRANEVGVKRVYEVSAWYGPSIERQLARFYK